MAESVKVEGLKELDRKIRELTKATGKNLLAPALRKAANVIRDQAIQNAPRDSTPDNIHIKDALKVRRDPDPQAKGSNEIMYVKPFKTKKLPVYYWRFVEFGTVKQKGQRFLTKAYDAKKREAVKVFMQSLGQAVIRETKKLSKLQK
ncbi:MAG: HK97 gp10 family phage protein [Ignavibacteriaceae bacterium]|nr:HK97 gp10 family phage protein [Ignavibacteriaceae bacterium]